MSTLPSDIKLNVLEFGGYMNIPDNELIERIQRYEPTFDIEVWEERKLIREDFLKRFGVNHPLHNLVHFLKTEGIALELNGIYGINVISNGDMDMADEIASLLSEAGYNIGTVSANSITTQDRETILLDLISIYIGKRSNSTDYISYGSDISLLEKNGLSGLVSDMNDLNTPDVTLTKYLRYVISRFNMEKAINGDKFYPLYLLLSDKNWRVTGNSLEIKGINSVFAEKIGKELALIYGPGKVQYQRSPYNYIDTFKLPSFPSELIDIDIFFHPYTINQAQFESYLRL